MHQISAELGVKASIFSLSYNYSQIMSKNIIISSSFGVGTLRFTSFENTFNPDFVFPFQLEIGKKISKVCPVFGMGLSFTGINQYKKNDIKRNWSINPFLKLGLNLYSNNRFSYNLSYYLLQIQKPKSWAGFSVYYEIH